jgi:hypothetical protein
MFSSTLESFKNSKKIVAYCKYFLLKGRFIKNSSGFNIVVLFMGGNG